LDVKGIILETNRAWDVFGTNNDLKYRPDSRNVNYLDVCQAAKGEFAELSSRAAQGIRAVIDGKFEEFTMDYPCHSPTKKMWFYMRATRIVGFDPFRVVVSHENITPLKLAEEIIKKHEAQLQEKTINLEEANTAMRVLLKQHGQDKQEMEEKVVSNVNRLITPYIEKLGQTRLDARQRTYLDIIESHLADVISPFLQRMSAMHLHLTPQEIQVATLVRDGRTTKEIADLLAISTNAVDFHRKNIRKKFGLNNKRTNLRSFLMSLT
jgi:DNA-binding CsgD family transcriptional regulator